MSHFGIPSELKETFDRAVRLEWWHVFWSITIIVVMGLVMGQSQTMKTAWVEDSLGLLPPVMFLVAARMERRRKANDRFPFGFHRVNGLGFFLAAVALAAVGVLLLYDASYSLLRREHATVGSIVLLGHEMWLGWLMIAAQVYSLVPPMIIGRKQLPLAHALNDKLLHTDALMNKANWLTGTAGVFGVLGLGMGWWWADSLAAGVISLNIIGDGVKALRSSTAELVDGAPRAMSSPDLSQEVQRLCERIGQDFPGSDVRARETGRLIHVEVHGAFPPDEKRHPRHYWPGDERRAWRVAQISFVPPVDDRPTEADEPT